MTRKQQYHVTKQFLLLARKGQLITPSCMNEPGVSLSKEVVHLNATIRALRSDIARYKRALRKVLENHDSFERESNE